MESFLFFPPGCVGREGSKRFRSSYPTLLMLDVMAQRVYLVFEPEALMVKLKEKALA